MIDATKKWIFLKISGAILVPSMLWFIINFIKIYDQGYLDIVNFFTNPLSNFLFSLFIINAYFFSALSISEVFEDYIKNEKIKNVANRLLYTSAVVIPLITIILIFKLDCWSSIRICLCLKPYIFISRLISMPS